MMCLRSIVQTWSWYLCSRAAELAAGRWLLLPVRPAFVEQEKQELVQARAALAFKFVQVPVYTHWSALMAVL